MWQGAQLGRSIFYLINIFVVVAVTVVQWRSPSSLMQIVLPWILEMVKDGLWLSNEDLPGEEGIFLTYDPV